MAASQHSTSTYLARNFGAIDKAHVIHQRVFERLLMLGMFLPLQLPRLNSELHINPTYRALDVLRTRPTRLTKHKKTDEPLSIYPESRQSIRYTSQSMLPTLASNFNPQSADKRYVGSSISNARSPPSLSQHTSSHTLFRTRNGIQLSSSARMARHRPRLQRCTGQAPGS
jgi:hypothetical protein